MDADLQQRFFLCCAAKCFQKECAFASGLLGNDNRPLLRKNIALILAIGQTADIRTGNELIFTQIDADAVVVFRERNICFHGFPRKSRRQSQLVAHPIVI